MTEPKVGECRVMRTRVNKKTVFEIEMFNNLGWRPKGYNNPKHAWYNNESHLCWYFSTKEAAIKYALELEAQYIEDEKERKLAKPVKVWRED